MARYDLPTYVLHVLGHFWMFAVKITEWLFSLKSLGLWTHLWTHLPIVWDKVPNKFGFFWHLPLVIMLSIHGLSIANVLPQGSVQGQDWTAGAQTLSRLPKEERLLPSWGIPSTLAHIQATSSKEIFSQWTNLSSDDYHCIEGAREVQRVHNVRGREPNPRKVQHRSCLESNYLGLYHTSSGGPSSPLSLKYTCIPCSSTFLFSPRDQSARQQWSESSPVPKPDLGANFEVLRNL